MGIKVDLYEFRQKLEQKKGKAQQVAQDLREVKENVASLKKEIRISAKVQEIIQTVAQVTQSELQYRITTPVSMALAAVYPENPYKMCAEFNTTGRGTTECQLNFERNGIKIDALDASGGGPVDVANFGLRIVGWSLEQPRSRKCLLLDEPFKWVSREAMLLVRQLVKQLSTQLGIQIVMVSHISELIDAADRVIKVSLTRKGVSKIAIEHP